MSTTTAGAIVIAGSLYPTAGSQFGLTLNSRGPITQTAPLLAVYQLRGSAGGAVTLTNPGNQIGNVGDFTAGGSFQLVDDESLTTFGTIAAADILLAVGPANAGNQLSLGSFSPATLAVGQGGTISLLTDNFANPYAFRGSTIIAPGGTVAIAPFTQGLPELFAEQTGSLGPGLVITAGDLASIQPGIATFRAGQIPGASGPTAGSIAFQEPVSLVGIANTLELDSTGPITQLSTATVSVNTLTGQAGSVALDQGNFIDNLAAFADMGGLRAHRSDRAHHPGAARREFGRDLLGGRDDPGGRYRPARLGRPERGAHRDAGHQRHRQLRADRGSVGRRDRA